LSNAYDQTANAGTRPKAGLIRLVRFWFREEDGYLAIASIVPAKSLSTARRFRPKMCRKSARPGVVHEENRKTLAIFLRNGQVFYKIDYKFANSIIDFIG